MFVTASLVTNLRLLRYQKFFLSLGLLKGRPSYKEKPSALKREHPALQQLVDNRLNLLLSINVEIVVHICTPSSGSGLRIRIRIQGPH
jgi:hypothetical protein